MLLTTDEEIGRGVAHVDMQLLDADYGYTLDGGDLGAIEFENFLPTRLSLKLRVLVPIRDMPKAKWKTPSNCF